MGYRGGAHAARAVAVLHRFSESGRPVRCFRGGLPALPQPERAKETRCVTFSAAGGAGSLDARSCGNQSTHQSLINRRLETSVSCHPQPILLPLQNERLRSTYLTTIMRIKTWL